MATSVSLGSQFTAEYLYAIGWADRLFESLAPAAMHMRPIKLRHPCIFYYGHLPAFTWNQIFRYALGRTSFNQYFDVLFERGIDPADDQLPEEKLSNWPKLEQIADYKQRVQTELFGLLSTQQDEIERNEKLRFTLNLVLEHYWMHVETFIYMMHQLPLELKRPICISPTSGLPPAATITVQKFGERAQIPAGVVTLGAEQEQQEFGWCNEFGSMRVPVDAFVIDKYPVTNGAFLEFVENGGYADDNLWSQDGWSWVKSFDRAQPQFWMREDGNWYQRGVFDWQPLDLAHPAWVSFVEAQAFATWKGARLMTEPEFHRAAYGSEDGAEVAHPWGNGEPEYAHGNFGLRMLGSEPVGSHPSGASSFGVEELVGNGWEWTQSPFAPFARFAKLPSYPGYSSDFFDGRHYVLKGGSPVTACRLLRRSFRNWFQPHYPYVYAKFRCIYGDSNHE